MLTTPDSTYSIQNSCAGVMSRGWPPSDDFCICVRISWARFRPYLDEEKSIRCLWWQFCGTEQSKTMICVLCHFALAACSLMETAAYAFTLPNLCLRGDEIFLFFKILLGYLSSRNWCLRSCPLGWLRWGCLASIRLGLCGFCPLAPAAKGF